MTHPAKTPPNVPRDRSTMPGSLSEVGQKLAALEERMEEGQRAVLSKLDDFMRLMTKTLDEALYVKQQNVDINVEIATLRNKVEDLELWRARMEKREEDGR